jgi:uncharacterized membrane protein YhaH (DUF805 family)
VSWYLKVLKNYVGFSGRARRKEFWMFTLFNLIIYFALSILSNVLESTALYYVALAYGLATLLPALAAAVRRLHDTGKSGAWYFIAFVPFIGGIWLIVLLAGQGNSGPNEYGDDPKAVPA